MEISPMCKKMNLQKI